jgi:hypothetical protein
MDEDYIRRPVVVIVRRENASLAVAAKDKEIQAIFPERRP